jgi:hypothetical protein
MTQQFANNLLRMAAKILCKTKNSLINNSKQQQEHKLAKKRKQTVVTCKQ